MNLKFTFLFLLTALRATVHSQYDLQWESTFNGQGDFSDKFTCLTTDADGNIYAAGSTISPGQSLNYLIAKFSSTGSEIWRKELNAPGNGPDQAKEIQLTTSGMLYVTGYGNGIGTGSDFYTVALNTSGDTLWTRMYNDPVYNQYDEAESVAVDNLGNIYVTGESDSDVSGQQNDDYLLVKYSSDGTFQWAKRFDGNGSQTDRAVKVVVFDSNNIYVTGRSFNGNDDDFVTIKYNGAGTVQWNQSVDNGGTDRATDMGIDNAGNIYVCGRRDNGNDDDFYVVKYNSSGTVLLTKFFDNVGDDRAEAIAVNGDGSFAVTGRSDINPTAVVNFDFYTLAYDVAGVQQWAKSFGGSGNNDDWPVAIDMNANNSVAVAGFVDTDPNALTSSFNLANVLYSNTGTELWSVSFDQAGVNDIGSGVVITDAGVVIGAGYIGTQDNDFNAAIHIHQSNGTDAIFSTDGIGDNTENIRDMVIGSDGSTYACGYSVGMDSDRNFFVMKLNASGQILWSDTLSGTMFGSDDEANAIALDAQSNVIVSGYIKNSGTGSDIAIRKYTSVGTLSWSVVYDGLAHEADRSYDLETDGSGNIYITGRTDVDPGLVNNDEIFTMKYSSAGALLWSSIHTGVGSEPDRGEFLKFLPNGNIVVVGRSNVGYDEDIELVSYNPSGVQQWATTYNSGSGSDTPEDVVVSSTGDVYVAGSSEEQPGTLITDAVLLKYDQAGSFLWSNNFTSPGSNSDALYAVTLDDQSGVYVGGSTDLSSGVNVNFDLKLIKYDANGQLQWQIDNDLSSGNEDLIDDMVWSNGKVYVVAHSDSDASTDLNYDIKLFGLSSNGDIENMTTYAASDSSDVADIIAVQGNNLFVGGSTWNTIEQRNALVLKYSTIVGIDEVVSGMEIGVFPNPTTDYISLMTDQTTAWCLYSASGDLIRCGTSRPGQKIDVSNLASGTYIIQINSATNKINSTFIKH